MLLKLVNFGCYENKSVTLRHGVTLIKGETGAGKSTIFEALSYVLYGKKQKPYRRGTKSCSVTLQLTGVATITRRSGPGHLSLLTDEHEYEGNEAQEIINGLFGTYTDFYNSSYMEQDTRSQLLIGTNTEKLEAIRTMGFKNDDVGAVQSKIKLALKDATSASDQASKKFVVAEANLNRFDKTHPDVVDTDIDTEQSVDDLIIQHKRLESNLVKLRQEHEAVVKLESRIDTLKTTTLDEVKIDGVVDQIASLKKSIAETQAQIEALVSKQAAVKSMAQIEKLRQTKQQAVDDLRKQMTEMSTGLELDKLSEQIEKLSSKIAAKQAITDLLSSVGVETDIELNKLKTEVPERVNKQHGHVQLVASSINDIAYNEEQKKKLQCPKCQAGLVMKDHQLHVIDEKYVPELRQVQVPDATPAMLKEEEGKLQKLRDEETKIVEAHAQYMKLLRNVSVVKKSEPALLEKAKQYQKLIPQLAKLEQDLTSITGDNQATSTVDVSQDLTTKRAELIALEKRLQEQHAIIAKHESTVQQRQQLQQTIDELGDRSSEEFKKTIEDTTSQIADLSKRISVYKQIFERRDLQTAYDDARKKLDKMADKAQNMTRLYETSKRVERQVLQDTVTSLNIEMAKYLTVLFPDDPITVEFKTTKDLKTRKGAKSMTCSLSIFYKDGVYDNYKQLSGGEKQRVSLAMMLAMNSMLGSDIILLDESLSGLHEGLQLAVIDFLKQELENKIVAIISHEGSEGTFHHVIQCE